MVPEEGIAQSQLLFWSRIGLDTLTTSTENIAPTGTCSKVISDIASLPNVYVAKCNIQHKSDMRKYGRGLSRMSADSRDLH